MAPSLPPDFWYQPAVARALSQFDLPAVLSLVTCLPGWSQEELASKLHYSRPTLNKIVNGGRELRLDEVRRIVRVLDIPVELIGFDEPFVKSDSPISVELDSRDSRGRSVMAREIRQCTARLSCTERSVGGNVVSALIGREVRRRARQVRASGRPEVVAAFGELSALAGYAHYDTQELQLAEYYYGIALQAAHESGDAVLVAQLRALLSTKATWSEQPAEGVSHCLTALDTPSTPRCFARCFGFARLAPKLSGMIAGRKFFP